MAKAFQVEIELKAVVAILADSEEDAHAEASNVIARIQENAKKAGLYIEAKSVKPRQLIARSEVP